MLYSEEEIREGLVKIKLPSSYKELRKTYEENPKYQCVSFEEFVKRMRIIKNLIDYKKYRLGVRT